jgi:hypothetical protein
MAQSTLPAWVALILGGGGIVGFSTLLFKLFEKVTDAKNAHIEGLQASIIALEKQYDRQVKFIEEQHQKEIDNLCRELEGQRRELANMDNLRKVLENAFDSLSRQEITPETKISLQKIEDLLVDIDQGREVLKSTKNAAYWLNRKKADWISRAVKASVERYPDLVKGDEIQKFESDIVNYVRWVYDSLRYGFLCRIEDYVRSPAIDSTFPYRAAFQELLEINDFGQLSESEVRDLQAYLYELSRQILT